MDEAGFARTGRAQYRHRLVWLGHQTDVLEYRFVRRSGDFSRSCTVRTTEVVTTVVTKGDVFKDHAARDVEQGLCLRSLLHIGGAVQDLPDAPGGCVGSRDRPDHAPKHHHREERKGHIVDRGHDLAHGEIPGDGRITAKPDDAHHRHIDEGQHGRD